MVNAVCSTGKKYTRRFESARWKICMGMRRISFMAQASQNVGSTACYTGVDVLIDTVQASELGPNEVITLLNEVDRLPAGRPVKLSDRRRIAASFRSPLGSRRGAVPGKTSDSPSELPGIIYYFRPTAPGFAVDDFLSANVLLSPSCLQGALVQTRESPSIEIRPLPIPEVEIETRLFPLPEVEVETRLLPLPEVEVETRPLPHPEVEVETRPLPLPEVEVETRPLPLPTPEVETRPFPLPEPILEVESETADP
ncbi:hypothetical protein NQ318_019909 [Aromia moschata]|uniref:Uncharacterized protein n=1 Tax=Aromia moschata TaxID=1265417 RepID=A0AAV8XIG9_9CUCU|nr:hypothetical protein NQ318_019909 [Aromia moschata]